MSFDLQIGDENFTSSSWLFASERIMMVLMNSESVNYGAPIINHEEY